MAKDNSVYIAHMLDCIARIDEYIESRDSFYSSRLTQDAVVRNLQVMAESSRRLCDHVKAKQAHIPWRAISGFRNILVHDYLGLDLDSIWSVIEMELPRLKMASNQCSQMHE